MTRPWTTIDAAQTDEGTMTLMRRGEREYIIRMEHYILMSSHYSRSEAALGKSACEAIAGRGEPAVLIAGLGMGFTLRAALDVLPAGARVTVAELNPVVVGWCRGPLAELTRSVLDDPRVDTRVMDVAELISQAAAGSLAYDAIVLDLYQGVDDANSDPAHTIYGRAALERARAALTAGGVFAVWTEDPDTRFEKRLALAGFDVERTRPGRGGPRYVVYLAKKTKKRARRRKRRAKPRRG